MKNINEILNHITNNPSYDKLNIFLEIKRFVNILPLKLKSGIKFVYIKNQTMHFVLTHQLFKVEFEHNKDTLKALLKMADIKDVSNFVFFVSNSVDNLIKKNSENIDKALATLTPLLQKELSAVEPGLSIQALPCDMPLTWIDEKCQQNLLNALYACPNG